jgi:hypothetical protein
MPFLGQPVVAIFIHNHFESFIISIITYVSLENEALDSLNLFP